MLILLKHGLANRLRTIAGYWYVADQLGEKITFHWDTENQECNGAWEEVFEPLSLIISQPKDATLKYDFIGQNTIDRIIKNHFPEEARATWNSPLIQAIEEEYYARFKICFNVLQRVFEVLPIEPFAAVHIRRTDHVVLAKEADKYTTFYDFDQFIAEHQTIYLATDSRDVQLKYPGLLKNIQIPLSTSLRQTSLMDAMVDILICSHAAFFKGSGYSSFSHLVDIYNRLNSQVD